MTSIAICAGAMSLILNLLKHTSMKRMNTLYSMSPSSITGATHSNYEGIQKRILTMLPMLEQPITIQQLMKAMDENYRTVYRDLSRIANLGYNLKNNKSLYWIEP